MTNFELIKVYQGPIEMLLKANMRLKDARFVRLYEDYLAFIRQGQKVTYAVAVLTERYHVSERKVYQIISTFGKSCTMDAPGITPPHLMSNLYFAYLCNHKQIRNRCKSNGIKIPFKR